MRVFSKKRSQFWDRSYCRMHYGRFGVAGGGVSPGAIIGLLGGAAGVIGELTLAARPGFPFCTRAALSG